MTAPPQFPGMNPYLESPYRWPEIHHALISELARTLNFQIVPKYRAAVETRVWIEISTPYEITEGYLEIREPLTKRVITVIEVLSPANKRPGEGRKKYLAKRETVLSSATHFVEIDLLRQGETMPIVGGQRSDYQILVSRADERPSAERYAFNLRDEMPKFLLPLDTSDSAVEPIVDIKALLNQVCVNTAVDIDIDYTIQPQPSVSQKDFDWMRSL
jgi:Protein of unknown function (DUF4058)